jgi:hypothetical protein
MNSRNPSSGAWVNLHPNEVFAACSNLIPLLPFNVSVWGLNLVTQYFDALSGELQDALHTDPTYLSPDISTLGARSSQLEALRYVRVAAVRQNTLLRNQEKLIAKTVNRKLKHVPNSTVLAAPVSVLLPQSPHSDDVSGLTHAFVSPAEQTMQRCQPSSVSETPVFPIDPATNFQSPYPSGFPGCMFCGDANHVFRQCPHNAAPGASAIFYKNLFAHEPYLRKRPPLPDELLPPNFPLCLLAFRRPSPLPPGLPLPPLIPFPPVTLPIPPPLPLLRRPFLPL